MTRLQSLAAARLSLRDSDFVEMLFNLRARIRRANNEMLHKFRGGQ
jgi:hypothetical protein